MARLRTETEIEDIVERCVEIERAGGDVLAYLRSENYVSPWGTWWRLQREVLGRKDHEIRSGRPRPGKREERKMAKVTRELVEQFCMMMHDGTARAEALRQLGFEGPKSAGQGFRQIKAWLKENDIMEYERIVAMDEKAARKAYDAAKNARKKEADAADPEAAADQETGKIEYTAAVDAVAVPVIAEPVQETVVHAKDPARIRVTAVATDFAEYSFDRKTGIISIFVPAKSFTDASCSFQVKVDEIGKLLEELPEVLREFGKGE